jgi:8-oxo-dGTP diphosphatase
MFTSVEQIDWAHWEPRERATLLFVIQDEKILLIHKKRGFGKGKINGPGGKIEAGETPLECALRETQEELCITPSGVKHAGELHFQFQDGHSIHGHVFTATDFAGTPSETEEAIPLWFPIDELPFERMWADDSVWFPYMLEGRPFRLYALFEEDRMLDVRLDVSENL